MQRDCGLQVEGYAYAAVQASQQCYAGNSISRCATSSLQHADGCLRWCLQPLLAAYYRQFGLYVRH
jgi:hypothetical protein